MQQEQILAIMKAYFADLHGPEALADFETTRAVDIIKDSVDAVTFVMHLNDETGLDIPMAQVAAGFTGQTGASLGHFGSFWVTWRHMFCRKFLKSCWLRHGPFS